MTTLGSVCEAVVDCEHRTAPTQPTGIPLIRTTDIHGGRLDLEGAKRISEETYQRWSRRLRPRPTDIVLAREAPVGEVGWVPPGSIVCLGQRTVLLRPDSSQVAPRYLLYLLMSEPIRQRMLSRAEGSTNPHLNVPEIRNMTLPRLPPIDEQRAIASSLGALDDRIDLNRRMKETLESIARAVFQSWFIDFDPVRAKADGRRPTGVDTEAAVKFPGSFDDSPLGPIPTGWQAVRLGTQVEAVRGLSYSGAGLTDAGMGLPLHNLNSVYEGGGYKYEGMKWYAGDYQPRHMVDAGDLLVVNTEQGHDRLLIGFAATVPSRFGDSGLFSADLFRIRPQDASPLTARYLYLLMAMSRYHDEIAGYSNGTTINHLPPAALQRPWIALPPREVVAGFEAIVGPMFERQEQLVTESATLAELRDALLPKLISGELRIRDAERLVGDAV